MKTESYWLFEFFNSKNPELFHTELFGGQSFESALNWFRRTYPVSESWRIYSVEDIVENEIVCSIIYAYMG